MRLYTMVFSLALATLLCVGPSAFAKSPLLLSQANSALPDNLPDVLDVTLLDETSAFAQATPVIQPAILRVESERGGFGESLDVTIVGQATNFNEDTPISVSLISPSPATPITPSGIIVESLTRIVATFAIPKTAPVGLYDIQVRVQGIQKTLEFPNGLEITMAAPDLQQPVADAVCIAPQDQFSWSTSDRALEYRLQVAREPDFLDLMVNETTFMTTFTPDTELIDGGEFYWRVVPIDNNSNEGKFEVWNFSTLPIPTIVKMKDNRLGCTIHGDSYTWKLDGVEIEGANDRLYLPRKNGLYTVVVEASSCVGESEEYAETTVGVRELTSAPMDFRAYPNPTAGVVNVEFAVVAFQPVSIELVSPLGATLSAEQTFSTGGVFQRSFDLSAQAAGMYYIRINDGLRTWTHGFVKQ